MVDKYNTEDNIVYKTVTDLPFRSNTTRYKRKLSIDKKGSKVHSYDKQVLSGTVAINIYLKPVDSSINFLVVGHSNFAYANRLPVDKDFAIFEGDAIVSYFNLIDKYDFIKGGEQRIPILTHDFIYLPPHKKHIRMRLVGEDTVTLNDKKMKTLYFKMRHSDKKDINMWVNRWTRAPILVEMPKDKLRAVLLDAQSQIPSAIYRLEATDYKEEEISFSSKDIALSGTLLTPKGDGIHPAVLLVCGPGAQDRDAYGIFLDLADSLAKRGYAVLRFDKRGVGKSEGSFSRFTGDDITNDVSQAISYLAGRGDIDRRRIAILGHSEGGYYAASLAAINPDISACIIMAGIDVINLPDTDLEAMLAFDKSAKDWDKEYLNDVAKLGNDTSQILRSGKDWDILLHKRVFLKKKRMDMAARPLEIIRKIKVPLLILGAKRDTVIPREHIKSLEESLKESGKDDYEIVFFNKLNHFFGEIVEDGIHRARISLDKDVAPTVADWLDERLVVPIEEEDDSVDGRDAEGIPIQSITAIVEEGGTEL